MESLPFYRRAVELNPNFAVVYARMGVIYSNAGERERAKENTRKAFELRDRVSEREKLYITEHYYETVTGELDKEIETLQLYQRTYPRDSIPGNNLAVAYAFTGQYEKAVEAARQSVQADPNLANSHSNLTFAYMGLNQLDEARQVLEPALARFPASSTLHWGAFLLALVEGKANEAQRELGWGKGKPYEYRFTSTHARAMAMAGKLHLSQELTERAGESQRNQNLKERAEFDLGWEAMVEADFGTCSDAHSHATKLLGAGLSRGASALAAFVFATCGDARRGRLTRC
jgi:tetratricopeptide (TPR) repeat protein